MSAWYDLTVATSRHDVPDFPEPSCYRHMARFTSPWLGLPETVLLAWEGTQVVGFAAAMLPELDNTETLFLELEVHPARRRTGIGTALLDQVHAIARKHDRRLIEVSHVAELPGGPRRDAGGSTFAARFGDKPGLINVRSRWNAGSAVTDQPAVAAGYSLIEWRGRTPDEIVDAIAALESRLLLDAPSGDLEIEPEKIDAVRLHANDETRKGLGDRTYTTAARHDASGEVVAHTMIAFSEGTDDHAWQQITIVDPAHRGHRLGLAIKLANHARVLRDEPLLRTMDTWNAETNTHMRAVNEQLGYRPVDLWEIWQLPVPAGS